MDCQSDGPFFKCQTREVWELVFLFAKLDRLQYMQTIVFTIKWPSFRKLCVNDDKKVDRIGFWSSPP